MRLVNRTRGQVYSRDVPIAIMPFYDASDHGNLELYKQLERAGFDIVTYYSKRTDNQYILEIACTLDPETRDTYTTFTATLSDGETGKVFMRAIQRRPRDSRATMRDLVKKIKRVLK